MTRATTTKRALTMCSQYFQDDISWFHTVVAVVVVVVGVRTFWSLGDFLDFVLASYVCLGFIPQYKTYILGQLVILTLASVNGCLIVPRLSPNITWNTLSYKRGHLAHYLTLLLSKMDQFIVYSSQKHYQKNGHAEKKYYLQLQPILLLSTLCAAVHQRSETSDTFIKLFTVFTSDISVRLKRSVVVTLVCLCIHVTCVSNAVV